VAALPSAPAPAVQDGTRGVTPPPKGGDYPKQ